MYFSSSEKFFCFFFGCLHIHLYQVHIFFLFIDFSGPLSISFLNENTVELNK